MERRTFVKLSAYTALILTVPFADSCKSNTDDPLEQPLLFSHIVDAKTIKEAGVAYRKATVSEDNKATLTQLLAGTNTSANKKTLQSLLDKQVVQDFKSGKTVTVSGWVLSVTEARQCALFSILNL